MSSVQLRNPRSTAARYRPSVGTLATLGNLGVVARRAAENYARRQARSRPATRENTNPSAPLTGNYDYKTDYSRRRLGRRARRRMRMRRKRSRKAWKRAKLAAATTTHILKRTLSVISSVIDAASAVSFGLYGVNGSPSSTDNPIKDVGELFDEMDSTAWANADFPAYAALNHKLYFQHATLEITVKNTSTENDALIEAYFIRGKRRMSAAWLSPAQVYDSGFAKQPIAAGPNGAILGDEIFETPLGHSMIGTTPFQNAEFTKGYNIYKRQKFRIPPGNEINFVISDSRPRSFSMIESKVISTDRRFHGVLFNQQGSPTSGPPALTAGATQVTYLAVRRYRMKMVRDNITTDAFDTSATV